MDGTFSAQRVDASWAGTAQNLASERLRATLPEGSEVRSVECRASLCRIETSHTDEQRYESFVRQTFLDPKTQLWNGGLFSTTLDDGQSEGRLVMVSYLAREGQAVPSFE
jgi:hypothetical protein